MTRIETGNGPWMEHRAICCKHSLLHEAEGGTASGIRGSELRFRRQVLIGCPFRESWAHSILCCSEQPWRTRQWGVGNFLLSARLDLLCFRNGSEGSATGSNSKQYQKSRSQKKPPHHSNSEVWLVDLFKHKRHLKKIQKGFALRRNRKGGMDMHSKNKNSFLSIQMSKVSQETSFIGAFLPEQFGRHWSFKCHMDLWHSLLWQFTETPRQIIISRQILLSHEFTD